ncbi:recombinase family protein [Candidatus Saccharibacteria bacterium]|nr:recombinase family protein [Candidatus Saccharibacteria bacterium]
MIIHNPQKTPHKNPNKSREKVRVAAYARVSTELDAQTNSYSAQISYYLEHISSNPNWQLVEIYADSGLTGTNLKKRNNFSRMVEDALSGKIDLILTKSISRFARNTVDALIVTRELKSKGIEVYFEKENISSLDPTAELIFTIMSSIAQEESRSISENVRWGIQRRMESGKITLPYKGFLGYDRGSDGLPVINEKEAHIVRRIYAEFLSGESFRGIAKTLTLDGVPTPRGKARWSPETVRSILSNEKYKGDALLQKTYTVDFLSHETRKNFGERKQWYIKDSHDAIIPPREFDRVQKEISRRSRMRKLSKNRKFSRCAGKSLLS